MRWVPYTVSMDSRAKAAIACFLIFCATAVAKARNSSQIPSTNQEQTSPSNAPAPATTGAAPTQDCSKSKDTCELPPEPQPAPGTPTPSPEHQQSAPPAAETKPPAKTANPAKKKKKHTKKKTVGNSSGPRKIVVRNGGTSEPDVQLSPSVPTDPVARRSTDQLLASAQNNLKTVSGRNLNTNQQATVDQIKLFIEQANAALKEGDVQRGHNLAMKAQLLSDDLVRH